MTTATAPASVKQLRDALRRELGPRPYTVWLAGCDIEIVEDVAIITAPTLPAMQWLAHYRPQLDAACRASQVAGVKLYARVERTVQLHAIRDCRTVAVAYRDQADPDAWHCFHADANGAPAEPIATTAGQGRAARTLRTACDAEVVMPIADVVETVASPFNRDPANLFTDEPGGDV